MSASQAAKTILLMGKCLPTAKENAVKVAISRFELNKYLNIYFKNVELVYAQDTNKVSKVGDIVLLEKLPEKITTMIQHRVKKVVFPLGDVTDPITGKKVVFDQYRDDMKESQKQFGEVESAFDYEKAPPRGWQEGKKDFTAKPVYKKYHVFEDDDQPYAK
ncbi:28S ribosomal protein S17, mitochondrial-like [Macrosteles quadrilineatus]|uniref:28S ribosomal protein S17, mitochondrial-like n=1 Tax=Macrosteles quadrilineatus TaxID=74068 RepID=UPI0023E28777|nr:28S ribosomal protein S17, mitochondrial-like [Macrosteles quadrilineatus]